MIEQIQRFIHFVVAAFRAMWKLSGGGWFVLRDASDQVIADIASVVPDETCDPKIHQLVAEAQREQEARKQQALRKGAYK